MDQNACSSPKLILWKGKKKTSELKSILGKAFRYCKDKIEIDFYIANQKYLKFCETILELKNIINFKAMTILFQDCLLVVTKDIDQYFEAQDFSLNLISKV